MRGQQTCGLRGCKARERGSAGVQECWCEVRVQREGRAAGPARNRTCEMANPLRLTSCLASVEL